MNVLTTFKNGDVTYSKFVASNNANMLIVDRNYAVNAVSALQRAMPMVERHIRSIVAAKTSKETVLYLQSPSLTIYKVASKDAPSMISGEAYVMPALAKAKGYHIWIDREDGKCGYLVIFSAAVVSDYVAPEETIN